ARAPPPSVGAALERAAGRDQRARPHDRHGSPQRRDRRPCRAADVCRVRAPAHARVASGTGLQPPHAARSALGRRRLPGAADDRRPRPASAREARAGSGRAGVHPDGAGRGLPLPRQVNPLRSVGGRLALGLALVVAGALLLADLIVVPSLERHLIDSKLSQLRHDTPAVATTLANSPHYNLHTEIAKAAQQADARVIYFTPQDFSRKILTVFDASNPVTSADVENDPYVVRAFNAYPNYVSGTVTSGGKRYVEVGFPLRNGAVVLVRASLRDTLQSISQVRRRLVIAGLIALAASLAVGYA